MLTSQVHWLQEFGFAVFLPGDVQFCAMEGKWEGSKSQPTQQPLLVWLVSACPGSIGCFEFHQKTQTLCWSHLIVSQKSLRSLQAPFCWVMLYFLCSGKPQSHAAPVPTQWMFWFQPWKLLHSLLLLTPQQGWRCCFFLPTGAVRVKVTNKPCASWPTKHSRMSWVMYSYGQLKLGSGLCDARVWCIL